MLKEFMNIICRKRFTELPTSVKFSTIQPPQTMFSKNENVTNGFDRARAQNQRQPFTSSDTQVFYEVEQRLRKRGNQSQRRQQENPVSVDYLRRMWREWNLLSID
jgi:hypothetical protein